MISKSVDLPAPFGPMIPTSSPGATSNEIERLATMPPKRFETPATDRRLTGRPARRRAGARRSPIQPDEAVGGPPHHHDERAAVDDEVDPDEPGADAAELRAQERLHGRDEGRAEERPERRAQPADDRRQREPDREVDREHVEGIDEPDVLRPQGAARRP